MKTTNYIAGAVVLSVLGTLQGCQHQQNQYETLKAKLAAEEQTTTALEARVTALEQEVKQANEGSWILWERRTLLKYSGQGVVDGPTPARPTDAFNTKDACLASATNLAASHGAAHGQGTWIEVDRERFGTYTSRVYYTCLPKGVPLKF